MIDWALRTATKTLVLPLVLGFVTDDEIFNPTVDGRQSL
jgi:hypothetical protein